MAPANVARASTSTDSVRGLAQAIAKPAYRRLLSAEPALRRAVPLLIITFLITMAVGTAVQVLDHRRQILATTTDDIEILADILAVRVDSATGDIKEAAKEGAREAARLAQEVTAAAIARYGPRGSI